MKPHEKKKLSIANHVGCFGHFKFLDPICKKHCALSLRCAIESDQKEQMEILEELVSNDTLYTRLQ